MSDELTYLQKFEGRVDRENHIIRGVPLITIGEAEGHDFEADQRTLELACKLIPTLGLKAKVNHRDASGVLSINGRFKNGRIDGDKLRADWHLNPDLSSTPHIEALAAHQPEDCGISLRFMKTLERRDGRSFIRPTSLKSADLVDDPACNESLLSTETVDSTKSGMDEKAFTELQENFKKLLAAHTELSTQVGTHNKFLTEELPDILEEIQTTADTSGASELSAIYRRGNRRTVELTSAEAMKQAVELATKPLLDKITSLETKATATETTLSAIRQPAIPANQTGAGTGPLKSKEETELQTKLESAFTELEAAKGLDKTNLAKRFKRELGENWKSKLTELKAK